MKFNLGDKVYYMLDEGLSTGKIFKGTVKGIMEDFEGGIKYGVQSEGECRFYTKENFVGSTEQEVIYNAIFELSNRIKQFEEKLSKKHLDLLQDL